jgi:hypothetical protein
MSLSVLLISAEHIGNSEFNEYMLEIGGMMVPGESCNFVINDLETDLWVSLQDANFYLKFYEEDTLNEWGLVLGGKPKSFISLKLDHSKECLKLYLLVAHQFMNKWKMIMIDYDDATFSAEDVDRRYEKIISE